MRPRLGFARAPQSSSRQVAALILCGVALAACKGSSEPSIVVGSVAVSPNLATRIPGETVQLTAQAKGPSGTDLNGVTFDWSSSNTSVATVDDNGLVSALAVGQTTITAEAGGKQGTATVTIAVPVTSITVTPDADTLGTGKSLTLSYALVDAQGAPVTGRTPTWTSSAGNVASVSNSGVVLALAEGVTTITGTIDGKSDAVTITVVDVCSTLLATPIAIGDTKQGTLEANDCTLNDGTVIDGYLVFSTTAVDVQIDMVSSVFDAFLILLEETQTGLAEVGFDDDGGGGTNARMLVTLEAGKIYYILANNFDPGVVGGYTLSLQDASLVAGARDVAPKPSVKARSRRPFAELWPIR